VQELLGGIVGGLTDYFQRNLGKVVADGEQGGEGADDAEDAPETPEPPTADKGSIERDVCRLLEGRSVETGERTAAGGLPPLQGDPLIQIGTTVHRYGSDEIVYKHIVSLGSCDSIPGVVVESCETEE
jgi:hypothetical protein